jgi:hypothetical protein
VVNLTGGAGEGQSSITIPAGKIFVLEFVSFGAGVPGGSVESLSINVTGNQINGGQGQAFYYLVIPPPNAAGEFHGSQALRVYAQPGTSLVVTFAVTASDPNNPAGVEVSLSGYFVNAQ